MVKLDDIYKNLKNVNIKISNLKNIYFGVDYYRWIEYSFTLFYFIKNKYNGKNVLDVGSLESILPIMFSIYGGKVTASDINQRVMKIEKYANKIGVRRIKSIVADVTKLPYPDNSFDFISAISVIEHVLPVINGDIKAFLEIYRVLKVDGTAIISLPFSSEYKVNFRRDITSDYYLMRIYDNNKIQKIKNKLHYANFKIYYFCDDYNFAKIWYTFLFLFLGQFSHYFSKKFLKLRRKPINAKGIIILLKK